MVPAYSVNPTYHEDLLRELLEKESRFGIVEQNYAPIVIGPLEDIVTFPRTSYRIAGFRRYDDPIKISNEALLSKLETEWFQLDFVSATTTEITVWFEPETPAFKYEVVVQFNVADYDMLDAMVPQQPVFYVIIDVINGCDFKQDEVNPIALELKVTID